ncbi:MAG: hypothetical protein JWO38_75 [Gemmataceae bacterium]|nr:hypothetical protein [Gemmataceae bacterium]
MATTDRPPRANRNRVALGVLGLLVVVGIVVAVLGLRAPPQMGADEEVFQTVDALFTAVTGRDEQQLGRCEHQLRAYRDAGRLPPGAAEYLDSAIHRARSGRWESAAEQLYDFMKDQRREGASHRPKKPDRPPKAR